MVKLSRQCCRVPSSAFTYGANHVVLLAGMVRQTVHCVQSVHNEIITVILAWAVGTNSAILIMVCWWSVLYFKPLFLFVSSFCDTALNCSLISISGSSPNPVTIPRWPEIRYFCSGISLLLFLSLLLVLFMVLDLKGTVSRDCRHLKKNSIWATYEQAKKGFRKFFVLRRYLRKTCARVVVDYNADTTMTLQTLSENLKASHRF